MLKPSRMLAVLLLILAAESTSARNDVQSDPDFPRMAGSSSARLMPADLTYLGAFRLPDSPSDPDNVGWEWSNWAGAATSYPGGDPGGGGDGFPGSLFGVGHDQTQYVSEISIPVPKVSKAKKVGELNSARTLQGFRDIKKGLVGYLEMPRVGLEYLPAQGRQTSGKLHFSWAQHLDEIGTGPTHGWCELDLSRPAAAGMWRMGGKVNYLTADYLFEIPRSWSDRYTPGYRLATGRYRDGGQGGQGPSLFAYAPWLSGNPPASGTTLPLKTLLQYGSVTGEGTGKLNGYHHSDEWNGGAWLTSGDKSAVVFVGNKGLGKCWYGCRDGTVWPDEPPFPPECEERGWWSTSFQAQIIFYDPADLAAVARGAKGAGQPQPYAVLNLDPFLFHITSTRQKHHVSAVAFDRVHGLMYVFEPFADGDKPIVHVWSLGDGQPGKSDGIIPGGFLLLLSR